MARSGRKPDGGVDAFHRQVDRLERGLDVHAGFRVALGEPRQSRQQPAGGKTGCGADRKPPLRAPSRKPRGRFGDRLQRFADRDRIGGAGLGQSELAAAALKQRNAEPIFQILHGVAHRAGGDVELLRRLLEAAVPGRRLEYAHGAQWWKLESHSFSSGYGSHAQRPIDPGGHAYYSRSAFQPLLKRR
jgi:hypothetical protein